MAAWHVQRDGARRLAGLTLVIGWWPRYPSAMPNQSSQTWSGLNNDQRSAMMRCRMYGWMGYPMRFHDTYFPLGDRCAEATLLGDGGGTYNVIACALEKGFDWNFAVPSGMNLTLGTEYQDVSTIFTRFAQKAVDGAELRLRWEYRDPPADPAAIPANMGGIAAYLDRLATYSNTAPMIGKVRLHCRAPAKIVSVERSR